MVSAVRSPLKNTIDDALQYWGTLRNRMHHSPINNYRELPSGERLPIPKVYDPRIDDGDALQRFATGLGIGSSEGAKESVAKRRADGIFEPGGSRSLDGETLHVPYSLPFWQSIYEVSNNIGNEMAWVFNNKRKTAAANLNPDGKEWKAPLDTAYVPQRRDRFKFDADLDESVRNVKGDFASALGVALGRIGADVSGHGTRKYAWNLNPEDFSGTFLAKILGQKQFLDDFGLEPSNTLTEWLRYGPAVGLGIGVQNWNPLNLAQGGRPAGFEAISANEDDPRESNQPLVDLIISRGLLGRNGWVLPWEQFTQERPDVAYADYEKYKEFLSRRNPGPVDRATLGLVKFSPGGIDGESPEARILGYRVTPEGIVGAGIGAAIPIAVAKEIKDGTFSNLLGQAVRAIR